MITATRVPVYIPPESLAFPRRRRLQRRMVTVSTMGAPTASAPAAASHEQLLVQVGARQDRAAFRTLFEHYAPRLKSYLMKHGASDALAEEIVQNTFVTIWEKAAQFDPKKAAASTWIFTIARNRRIDAIRREKYIEIDSENPALELATSAAPDDAYVDTATAEKLRAAIEDLPPEQSALLRMAFFEDKTHQAISDETRIPLGTVKSRLRLAVEKLRGTLGKGTAANKSSKEAQK